MQAMRRNVATSVAENMEVFMFMMGSRRGVVRQRVVSGKQFLDDARAVAV
jgi:hypothetical protein